MGGEMNGAEKVHERCSKWCSGGGLLEGVDWHGFATDDLTGVQLWQNFAFVYTPP
jgi:hypothetical protein